MPMADMETAGHVIRLLNDLLKLDPDAIKELIESRVQCNEALANHDTVQVSGYADPPDGLGGSDTIYRVGLLGILNGLCGAYGEEGGDKVGWGPITAVFDEDKVVSFRLTKCVQCLHPHYDGICECGGWGEAEDKMAAEWHKKKKPEDPAVTKMVAEVCEQEGLTNSVEDLQKLWDR
jgi:hypothetical protein